MIKSSEKNQNLNSSKTKPCFSAVGHQTTRCVYHWTSSKQLQKNISVSVLSSPEAEQHLSSKRFFLSFCFSFFIQCSPFRLFLCSSPSIALRLIGRRTMRQSGRQLFSVNSAMILALCISPLMLLNVTPSCCSALWAIKSNFIKSRSHSPLAEWSLCVCVWRKRRKKQVIPRWSPSRQNTTGCWIFTAFNTLWISLISASRLLSEASSSCSAGC